LSRRTPLTLIWRVEGHSRGVGQWRVDEHPSRSFGEWRGVVEVCVVE
jgi:hypothetical protein